MNEGHTDLKLIHSMLQRLKLCSVYDVSIQRCWHYINNTAHEHEAN